jgi:hypothetical protein
MPDHAIPTFLGSRKIYRGRALSRYRICWWVISLNVTLNRDINKNDYKTVIVKLMKTFDRSVREHDAYTEDITRRCEVMELVFEW